MNCRNGSFHLTVVVIKKDEQQKNSLDSAFRVRLIFQPGFISALFKSALAYLDSMTHNFFFLVRSWWFWVIARGKVGYAERICYISKRDEPAQGERKKGNRKPKNSSLRREQGEYYSTLNNKAT